MLCPLWVEDGIPDVLSLRLLCILLDQEGERASSLLPQEDNPADKGKGLRQQKKGKAGAGRGSGAKSKKLSLLGPTTLTRGEQEEI